MLLCLLVLALAPSMTNSFVVAPSITTAASTSTTSSSSSSQLSAIYSPGRSASRSRNGKDERSKRQFRVGELVRTELARILHTGLIKGDATYLEQELRQRISIVSVDVSPDLRQARICVSIRNANKRKNNNKEEEGRGYGGRGRVL